MLAMAQGGTYEKRKEDLRLLGPSASTVCPQAVPGAAPPRGGGGAVRTVGAGQLVRRPLPLLLLLLHLLPLHVLTTHRLGRAGGMWLWLGRAGEAWLAAGGGRGAAQHLEEGGREGEVDAAPVLQALGQEHAQQLEALAHDAELGAVLRPRRRKQAVRTLNVVARRLATLPNVDLGGGEGEGGGGEALAVSCSRLA